MSNSVDESDSLFDSVLDLFLRIYCSLHSPLEQSERTRRFRDLECATLLLIDIKGGSAKRPTIWKPLGLTSGRYTSLTKRLREKWGLIHSPLTSGLTKTDELTDEGKEAVQEIKRAIRQPIETFFLSMSDEQKATVMPFLESLEAVIENQSG